jgi:excisionase family DNA binding protein
MINGVGVSYSMEAPQMPKYLTPGDAAERLQVSRWTILRWISEGRFEGVTRGGFGRTSPHKIPEKSVNELAQKLGILPPNGKEEKDEE